jgi:hypothetical protein
MYLHDAMQEYAKSHDDFQRLSQKAKKIAQLTQKLYQLDLLEETLRIKLRVNSMNRVAIMKAMSTEEEAAALSNEVTILA